MTPSHKPTTTAALMRRLSELDEANAGGGDHTLNTGQSRWMIPYADLLTLLLGFFLVVFSVAKPSGAAQASTPAPSPNAKAAHAAPLEKPADARTLERLAQADIPGARVLREERGIVISLKDNVLFAPGSADLSDGARQTLARLSQALRDVQQPIRVEGHTDNTPIATADYPSNWELSTARATNIVRTLITEQGFSPAQLSAAGYGEFRPAGDNSSIEGKQKNRRVDIVILNQAAERQEPGSVTSAPQPAIQ